jgi:outer membrane protein OmpA-like peptidoglycan-associated protein/Tol biopolymer transport system component
VKKYLVLLFTLSYFTVFAQNTLNKKAFKLFTESAEYMAKNNFVEAENLLRTALEIDPNFADANLALGTALHHQEKYLEAKNFLSKGISANQIILPDNYFYLAEAEFATLDYEKAKLHFQDFLRLDKTGSKTALAKKYLLDCDFAVVAIKNPVKYAPKNLGSGVNTANPEYFPAITADGETLIFTRQIDNNEDFWTSNLNNGVWDEAKPLEGRINTKAYNEGAQAISPDGKHLFFTGCNRPDGAGRCDIYVSTKEGNAWGAPSPLPSQINTPHWESQPSLSPDGKTLYFISNRPGGQGGYDIWKSTINDEGKWSNAENLGPEINTPYDENTPFMHVDGKTLYFSSSGWPGFGHKDIFYSRADENGKWQKPVNLGYPINTFEDETGLIVSADGNYGFFSSNLKEGFGAQDIYSFGLPEKAKPLKVSYVKGIVRDKDTKETIESYVQVIDLKTNRTVFNNYTDKENGEFLAVMPVGSNYMFNVSAPKYLFYSKNFELKTDDLNKPYILEVGIEKIKTGGNVTLNNIFFDTNKFNLLPQSITELDILIDFLTENETVNIEIQGHTDNVGNNILNEKLSLNRANAVYEYLIKNNIDAKRLSFKGFGANKPIADNKTEAGRKINRRTSFVITKV